MCAITGVSHMRGGWRLLVLLDWARGLDGVFVLTRREHHWTLRFSRDSGAASSLGEGGGLYELKLNYEVVFASK